MDSNALYDCLIFDLISARHGLNGSQDKSNQNEDEVTNDTRMVNSNNVNNANPVQQMAPAMPASIATPSISSSWMNTPLNTSGMMIGMLPGIPLNSLNESEDEPEPEKDGKNRKKGRKSKKKGRRGKKNKNKKDKGAVGPYPVVVSPGKNIKM